jgi:magnesium and cobalt exporter, CNNM family
MIVEVVLIIVLAILNGYLTLSEIALMTARKHRLKQLAESNRGAKIALALSHTPERFLAAVQVFITLLTIGTGTALGVRFGEHIAALIDRIHSPWLSQYAPALGVVLSVSFITFVTMLLGELLPKRVALVNPERFAVATAVSMRVLTTISLPFAFVLIWCTRAMLRLLRLHRASSERISEEEIRLIVSESAEQGVIDSDERNMVNRVLRLGDRSVDSLMTPRPRIAWLDISAPLEENLAVMREAQYSRYPVCRISDKEVVGIFELKQLADRLGDPHVDLFRKLSKPLFVPATARGMDLLEEFRDAETTLALVVDEYGDIAGLITLNDLLGAVVGKAATPLVETASAPIVKRDDGSWLVDGSLSIDDLRELLGGGEFPLEEDDEYHTAAGMLITQFGRIPHVGEHFDWRNYRLEIVDLDGARIDKILVSERERPEAGDDSG